MMTRVVLLVLTAFVISGKAHAGDWTHGGMAVTANPHATDAAIEMLSQGGHAVDAAIAAHLVLGLVEPQSSGIGGGGFLLVFEREDQALVFHDGRETAPSAASPDMFLTDGEVMPFMEAWQSGLSIGVPGAVALYKQAHDRHGRLPWPAVFEPAVRLAEEGFAVSPRLAGFLVRIARFTRLDENPGASDYFYPQGEPLKVGEIRKNPEYAATLRALAKEGAEAFYQGELARAIVAAAQAEPNPGRLSLVDLENYAPKTREAVCGEFRALSICSASPPSSGGAQIMIAQLYDHLLKDASDGDKVRAFVDAQRLAYADRDHYFADPDYVEVPLKALLGVDYLRQRASDRADPDAAPRHGNLNRGVLSGSDTTEEAAGTTHLSIVDSDGNAVSFTATVEAAFGSSRWVQGFLLNNEMTDFARSYESADALPANAVTPGKRPRSSMSPTFVFDAAGDLLLVTGSPGGNSIPAYVSKTIIGLLDWNLSPQEAVDFPNIVARGKKVRVETAEARGSELAKSLRAYGYEVQEREGENSGLHLIYVSDDGLVGAADRRREGTVRAWTDP
ncbi:MAG: gamma-glutamyltransferase [OM182 bacterium]|nr:MAG: gamma-glutamyltransferase [OM182 bacterium]